MVINKIRKLTLTNRIRAKELWLRSGTKSCGASDGKRKRFVRIFGLMACTKVRRGSLTKRIAILLNEPICY